MVWVLGTAVIVLLITVLALMVKLYYLRRSADEIAEGFCENLDNDTNTLIDLSSRDKHMMALAETVNEQLRQLRKQRRKYLNGDRELKEAVTNISHDLRTPLTAICGCLDLMENEEKSESVTRYLEIIRNRTENLKQLTEELFRYSVILSTSGDMELEDVSLNGVLEESIAGFYGALTERNIIPVINITEVPVVKRLNKAGLSRIFSNILNNVLKYSDGDLEIVMTDEGKIVFSNTATALDEVQVGKLFDRFFTVESARNSTGLGLAIAKTMIEQMNGKISARYGEGKLNIDIYFD